MTRDFQDDISAIESIEAVPAILNVVCRVTGMGFAAVARVTAKDTAFFRFNSSGAGARQSRCPGMPLASEPASERAQIEVSHRLVVEVALSGLLHPLHGQKTEQSHRDHTLPAQCTASLHGNAKNFRIK